MTATAREAAAASASRERFALDVQYYLTQTPRQLPSRYFYDAVGSALFEAICRLPWYPLTRAELRLIAAHARDALDGGVATVIELGPGGGAKLCALFAASGRAHATAAPIDVHMVDVSATALAKAQRALDAFAGVLTIPHETTYEAGLELFGRAARKTGPALALFLGSNIGNFDPPGRDAFLRTVRAALRPADRFLLGVDLVKPESDVLLAYDDPLGVTAAFNRNLLVRINSELGGRIDLDGFAHRALWNAGQSRVEMHLVSRRRQRIVIPAAAVDLVMRQGETIWTESSYKYEPTQILSVLAAAGFRAVWQGIDETGRFALTCAEAA